MLLNSKINQYINEIAHEDLLRKRVLTKSLEKLIYFDSNDYLSLSTESSISSAYQLGYASYPSGSGGSMLLSGYHPNHKKLEERIAHLLEVDDCILFSSGYAANLAVTALLGRLKVHCFIDKEIHASVYDGLHLSQVHYTRYVKDHLEKIKKQLPIHYANAALFTEGIFSMSGQRAPLELLSSLCIQNQSALIVDEAHSFGILGKFGLGAVADCRLTQKEVPLRVIPFGKAMAAQGAVVAGHTNWINALLQAGRSLIYSTAVSPALSYGLLKTLEFLIQADDRRDKLMQLVGFFRALTKESSFSWADSSTPIQQLQLGCPNLALYYARELKKQGIICSAIRKPTVTTKNSGLRIILNYNHTIEQIYDLFEKLNVIYESKHFEVR